MFALKERLEQGLNAVLPPRCLATGERVESQGTLTPAFWQKLTFISAPYCYKCGVPFDFEIEPAALCSDCLNSTFEWDRHISALIYNEASRQLILGFKHSDRIEGASLYAQWMFHAGRDLLQNTDFLLPVPLHRWRLLKRRYNQSALLATRLSRLCNITVLYEGLLRCRHTPSQGGLKSGARHKNVRGAFEVSPRVRTIINDARIVLIDDVFTTGATLNECAKTLKRAGVRSVSALTLARTVYDSDY